MHYLIRNKINFHLIIPFLIVVSTVAQTDWQRWEKTEPNYLKETIHFQRDYSYQDNSLSYIFSKTLINAYWLCISDVDGDNCPFHPSCSTFFIEAIDGTNLIQGTLMFFDRFSRDTNPVNRENHYPVYKNFRYFDPPQLYTLNKDKIKYIPAGKVVY